MYVSYQDITDADEVMLRKIRKKVTMVFQSGALFDSLTVRENILFSLELRDDYDAANKEEVVHGLLQIVGLTEYEGYLSDRSFHRLQARRSYRQGPGGPARMYPLR